MNTQLAWQRAEDPNGNPWLAIVIDPLRSFAKNRPEVRTHARRAALEDSSAGERKKERETEREN